MPVRPAKPWTPLVALLGVCVAVQSLAAAPVKVTDVRLWAGPEGTRLVLDLSAPVRHQVFTLDNPDRVVIDLANTELALRKELPSGQGPVKAVRSGPQAGNGLRIVLDLSARQSTNSFLVGPDGSAGHRLVVEMPSASAGPDPGRGRLRLAQHADAISSSRWTPGRRRAGPGAMARGGTREKRRDLRSRASWLQPSMPRTACGRY
jgi:N-acetylmuramoyl-L-alanine amidase